MTVLQKGLELKQNDIDLAMVKQFGDVERPMERPGIEIKRCRLGRFTDADVRLSQVTEEYKRMTAAMEDPTKRGDVYVQPWKQ